MALIGLVIVFLVVLFIVNGGIVLDHSGERRGEQALYWNDTLYVPCSGEYSEGKTIAKTTWDAKGNRAKGKSKEAREINLALDNIKAQIIKHYQRISDREAYVTAEMVRNAYQGIGTEYERDRPCSKLLQGAHKVKKPFSCIH